jgi:hypothetical protein
LIHFDYGMAMCDIKLTLPDGLAREAEANGLLTPETLERLLREELRRRRVNHLFEATGRLAEIETPPLTGTEVEAEIQAARRSRRATDARRR